jgi:hypothetical protein
MLPDVTPESVGHGNVCNGLVAVTRISLQYTAVKNWQFKLLNEISEQFVI